MPLLEAEVPRDPILLFDRWFREATQAGALQPEAMTLATTGEEGPSARMVLFKGILDGTFLFYSNYASRKGRDLSHDRRAALVFYWSVTRHQVRVYGPVRKVGHAASLAYFAGRPRGAQLSSLASPPSEALRSRAVLEPRAREPAGQSAAKVPLPNGRGRSTPQPPPSPLLPAR